MSYGVSREKFGLVSEALIKTDQTNQTEDCKARKLLAITPKQDSSILQVTEYGTIFSSNVHKHN